MNIYFYYFLTILISIILLLIIYFGMYHAYLNKKLKSTNKGKIYLLSFFTVSRIFMSIFTILLVILNLISIFGTYNQLAFPGEPIQLYGMQMILISISVFWILSLYIIASGKNINKIDLISGTYVFLVNLFISYVLFVSQININLLTIVSGVELDYKFFFVYYSYDSLKSFSDFINSVPSIILFFVIPTCLLMFSFYRIVKPADDQ